MKVLLLLLTIFIVNVWCKQRCNPISNATICPNPPRVVSSFDVEKAAGKWYFPLAYPNLPNFNTMDCFNVDNELTCDGSYIDNFCAKFDGVTSCQSNELKHANHDGKATFSWNGQDFEVNYIYIDYANYYVCYTCQDTPDGYLQKGIWIASRTPILCDELRNEAYGKIQEAGFSVYNLRTINQDEEFCASCHK